MEGKFEILLVDDSSSDALIFQEALRAADENTLSYWVGSGEEALAYLSRTGEEKSVDKVRLIVLDVDMPGLSGLETLRMIRSRPQLTHLPVVMLSGSRKKKDISLAYSLGASVFFQKPASLSQYVECVSVLVKHWLHMAVAPFLVFAL